jgi:hypothetical protein
MPGTAEQSSRRSVFGHVPVHERRGLISSTTNTYISRNLAVTVTKSHAGRDFAETCATSAYARRDRMGLASSCNYDGRSLNNAPGDRVKGSGLGSQLFDGVSNRRSSSLRISSALNPAARPAKTATSAIYDRSRAYCCACWRVPWAKLQMAPGIASTATTF